MMNRNRSDTPRPVPPVQVHRSAPVMIYPEDMPGSGPRPGTAAPSCPPQADHDQGWQREKRRSDCSEQADGNKSGQCH